MKLLITGICGFAGSTLALRLRESQPGLEIFGVDNFIRAGSEMNRQRLQAAGIKVFHADLRVPEDVDALPAAHWVLDAAANPSVLAGLSGPLPPPGLPPLPTTEGNSGAGGGGGRGRYSSGSSGTSSRQLMQHNLGGTINVLEYCRRHAAGFTLLSTSRVYSIPPLAALKLTVRDQAFQLAANQSLPVGVTERGIAESFSVAPPVSLYGATKVCSEALALEYGLTFKFPVWINRLGVLAGAGQFGRADQGIFSFWIHSVAAKRPLKFIGFGGQGHQVRDCLHPHDLSEVLLRQMDSAPAADAAITNFAGGVANSMSLRQLHDWAEARFGKTPVQSDLADRPFDLPWVVLDSALAGQRFGWRPVIPLPAILEEIARHAEQHPNWLDQTA